MTKKIKQTFELNPNDISLIGGSSSSGKKGQFSRKLKTTSYEISLTHNPTNICVEGEVPDGNYSKKEMIVKREQLNIELMNKLEKLVIKKLKLKGY